MKFDKIKKQQFLQMLIKTLGNVTQTCKATGIHKSTYYRALQSDLKFAAAIKDIPEVTLDYVEHQLLKKIKAGDTTAIIFFLKTKGKHRGYVERETNVIHNTFEGWQFPKATDTLTYINNSDNYN